MQVGRAEAASRYANSEIGTTEQLWDAAQNWTLSDALIRGLCGHVGEQEAARLLGNAGLHVQFADGGTNPGWDITVNGVEANVKVVGNAEDGLQDHFDRYPDILVIVNSDAAKLPPDALRVDPEKGLDADLLIGENRVLVLDSLQSPTATPS